MFDVATLLTFLGASIAIILAPGPAQALVLTRTISDGRKAGLLTAVGLNVGTLFHAFAAALGLSAILATSALAFTAVKFAGAAYLFYLGIQALRAKAEAPQQTERVAGTPWQMFTKAVVIGLLNPKVALFFMAFLPQFVDPQHGSTFVQFMLLGGLLAALDIVYEAFLTLMAAAMGGWLNRKPHITLWRQRITGMVLVGLGIRLALTQRE